MQQHKTLTKFSSINVLLRNLTAGYAQLKAKRIEIVSLFIVVVAMASYFNPQAAIDLWLSKDQQAQIHFNQGIMIRRRLLLTINVGQHIVII